MFGGILYNSNYFKKVQLNPFLFISHLKMHKYSVFSAVMLCSLAFIFLMQFDKLTV
ncbi:hypothetical protein AsAng_0014140 [Aureispira anguillae]|uniref:Uncharacterized protein n=1 Tax=Aureispira anguillae TaxID=2864201 RepID=A0A916DRK8_9BACT|nr:hypothetical protein AsAng_0014140 [Aureispira anguillae]